MLFGDLLIIWLLIKLFHSVLLVLPLFTTKYQSCNVFFVKDTQLLLVPQCQA